MDPITANNLTSTADLSELLGVTPSAISRWVKSQDTALECAWKIPTIRGSMYFNPAQVEIARELAARNPRSSKKRDAA